MSVGMKKQWIRQYEQELQDITTDLQIISLLQRKGQSKLQLVQRRGVRYIKCLVDKDALTRCVIVSLCPSKLMALKNLLYGRSLTKLTSLHGLVVTQIHSLIYQKLTELEKQSSEQAITKAFNTCPFFDEGLIEAFKEKYAQKQGWNYIEGDVYAAIGQDFSIIITDRPSYQHGFLWVQNQNKEWLIPSVTQMSQRSHQSLTNSSASSVKNQFETVSMTTPSEFLITQDKQNRNPNFMKKPVKGFVLEERVSERRKSGGIWGWLCCGQ